MSTATDLKRAVYFQGKGLVDSDARDSIGLATFE